MSFPRYTTLISGIVTRLQNDARLDYIPDTSIYYGNPQQIPSYPAISVELLTAQEEWKTFPAGKDLYGTFRVRVVDTMMDYVSGLTSVEDITHDVDKVFHSDIGISGLAYWSQVSRKDFSVYEYDNIPILACDMELSTVSRFSPTG
jgi:hypothetical protein